MFDPKDPETRWHEMQKLKLSGLSLSEIGTRYGISRQRVFQLLVKVKTNGKTKPKTRVRLRSP